MTVTVYATSRCPQCHATRRQLDRMGIEYETVNVDADADALSRLRDLGYRQAPVVVAGDRTWTGYRPDLLKQLGAHVAYVRPQLSAQPHAERQPTDSHARVGVLV